LITSLDLIVLLLLAKMYKYSADIDIFNFVNYFFLIFLIFNKIFIIKLYTGYTGIYQYTDNKISFEFLQFPTQHTLS